MDGVVQQDESKLAFRYLTAKVSRLSRPVVKTPSVIESCRRSKRKHSGLHPSGFVRPAFNSYVDMSFERLLTDKEGEL